MMLVMCAVKFTCIQSYCKNVVVVIDPGHGGEAEGGTMDDRIERDIDLITAQAMKERLEMYEGVDVYITRDNNEDKEMTRKDRLEFAKKVDADFLFSIHYNMSEYHTLFGSEVWIGSLGKYYVLGYQFATIEMEALTGMGLFDRGIKNKLDKDKSGEYYGILKYAEEYDIPAVIIEHCHLDEERDSAFWNEESYINFGRTDADCVAKFFKLSSQSLGIDNSDFTNVNVQTPTTRVDRDETEPDYCDITVDDDGSESVTVNISAYDQDNYIQYYQYSTDGGNTFSRLEAWDDRSSDSQSFEIEKPVGSDLKLIVRALNKYDLYSESQMVTIEGLPLPEEEEVKEAEAPSENTYEDVEYPLEKTSKNVISDIDVDPVFVFLAAFIVLFITLNIIFAVIISCNRKKRRKKRKKTQVRREDHDILEDFDYDET